MVETRQCGQCGKPLPQDAPAGLCPECLLRLGMQSQSKPPADSSLEGVLTTAAYGQAAADAIQDRTEHRHGERLSLTAGQQFGGYRIVRRLGSGGMGAVYEADHLESGRRVALKVLAHRLDSAESKQRFLREGRLAASVNHPNSVYVFGTEEIAGIPVIAMELVPGGTLEERVLREGPLPVGEAVDAILQVIDGLAAAQARGVLHRDVKPANCFVDRDGTVKVGDFGLSISTSLRGDSNVTSDGTFLGTPAFSSPEQLRGDELDIRSDIYAVGVTLYYLLTGQMPFKADNLVRLIATVLENSPTSPERIRPDIPQGLARTVMRCLQKQPAARFSSYEDLRQAVAPFGSAALTPAALGLRLGAGILDHVLCAPFVSGLMLFSAGGLERVSSPDYFGSLDHNLRSAIIALMTVFYFAIPEGLWGASLGKAICGIRVADPQQNVPGVPRALGRALIYVLCPQTVFLVCMGLIGVGAILRPPMWLLHVISYSWFAMLAVMFSTARRANGYAGFQDLASGTRVLAKSIPGSRPILSGIGDLPEQLESTPTVGPYHVLASLPTADDAEMLLGYDQRLLRRVWIRKLPDGRPAVATANRNLARPGRLRWLAGRRDPGACWDAYEAPAGTSLVNLLPTPQPWSAVRYWLTDLADELAAGQYPPESLPDVLALNRVWITAEGRAKLLDFPAPCRDAPPPPVQAVELAGHEAASPAPFLNMVAIAALEGSAIGTDEAQHRPIATPLPLRARDVLDGLPRHESPESFARRLKPLLSAPATVGRGKRLGMLAACVVVPLFMAVIMAIGSVAGRQWLDRHPEMTSLYYCLEQLEKLDRSGGNGGDRAQERRALEIYVAHHFHAAITDPAVWSHWYARSLFTANQRTIAERVVAEYPATSPQEMVDATARLHDFLAKMPQGLPGAPRDNYQVLWLAVAVAIATALFALVAVPGLVCSLLFRGGLLLCVFGLAVVNRDGTRASRLRAFWRSIITWSPLVLGPLLLLLLKISGLGIMMSVSLALALLVAVMTCSALLPERGIPDRIAGTYLVPR